MEKIEEFKKPHLSRFFSDSLFTFAHLAGLFQSTLFKYFQINL